MRCWLGATPAVNTWPAGGALSMANELSMVAIEPMAGWPDYQREAQSPHYRFCLMVGARCAVQYESGWYLISLGSGTSRMNFRSS